MPQSRNDPFHGPPGRCFDVAGDALQLTLDRASILYCSSMPMSCLLDNCMCSRKDDLDNTQEFNKKKIGRERERDTEIMYDSGKIFLNTRKVLH